MVHKVTNLQQIALQSQFIMYQSMIQILGTVAFLLPVKVILQRGLYFCSVFHRDALPSGSSYAPCSCALPTIVNLYNNQEAVLGTVTLAFEK